jgi:hypothetical protein
LAPELAAPGWQAWPSEQSAAVFRRLGEAGGQQRGVLQIVRQVLDIPRGEAEGGGDAEGGGGGDHQQRHLDPAPAAGTAGALERPRPVGLEFRVEFRRVAAVLVRLLTGRQQPRRLQARHEFRLRALRSAPPAVACRRLLARVQPCSAHYVRHRVSPMSIHVGTTFADPSSAKRSTEGGDVRDLPAVADQSEEESSLMPG